MAKFSYSNINPRTISKIANQENGAKRLRAMYSAGRSILRKRNERITAAGYKVQFPTPPKVQDISADDLPLMLAKLAKNLRSPVSTLSGKIEKARKTAETLKSHKYNIEANQLDDFGKFMEATRKRQGETYKGKSKVAAQAYTELVKTGVSGKTVERSFKKWLEDFEKLNVMVTSAQNLKDKHPRKRVTAAELKDLLSRYEE